MCLKKWHDCKPPWETAETLDNARDHAISCFDTVCEKQISPLNDGLCASDAELSL